MSFSSSNYGSGEYLKFDDKICRQCRQKAAIFVSQSDNNYKRLYYKCNNGCGSWIGWCNPINDSHSSRPRNDPHSEPLPDDASELGREQIHELLAENKKLRNDVKKLKMYTRAIGRDSLFDRSMKVVFMVLLFGIFYRLS